MYYARCCFCYGNTLWIFPIILSYIGVCQELGCNAGILQMMLFAGHAGTWSLSLKYHWQPLFKNTRNGTKEKTLLKCISFSKTFVISQCVGILAGHKTFQKCLLAPKSCLWWVLQQRFAGRWASERWLEVAVKLWVSFPLLCKPGYKWEKKMRVVFSSCCQQNGFCKAIDKGLYCPEESFSDKTM